jgi:hypothetical protein
MMKKIPDGQKFNVEQSSCILKEVFNSENSNLNWLALADLKLRNSRTADMAFKKE